MTGFLPFSLLILFNLIRPSRPYHNYIFGGQDYALALPPVSTKTNPEVAIYIALWNEKNATIRVTLAAELVTDVQVKRRVTTRVQLEEHTLTKWSGRKSGALFIFDLRRTSLFSLCVVYNARGMAAQVLMPVQPLRGVTYFVVTLEPNPLIIITSSTESIFAQLKFKFSNDYVLDYWGTFLRSGDSLTIPVPGYESVTLGQCSEEKANIDFTGTKITADSAFSVLGGSCSGESKIVPCSRKRRRYDAAFVDQSLPLELYGKEFVFIHIPERDTRTLMIIVAGYDNTVVNASRKGARFYQYYLNEAGDYNVVKTRRNFPYWVASNQPIQVVYVLKGACLRNDSSLDSHNGSVYASICVLVPNELFYVFYFVITPSDVHENHYVALVIESSAIYFLQLDGAQVPSQVYDVEGELSWVIKHVKLKSNFSTIQTTISAAFGCYVYGFTGRQSYLYPAGRLNLPPEPVPEERIDLYNAVINNKKLQIYKPKVDGHWTEWENGVVRCNDTCDVRLKYILRECNNPPQRNGGQTCTGISELQTEDFCPNHYCLEPCPSFTFGTKCESCRLCDPACDNVTGVCESCKVGYKHPEQRCKTKCAPSEYGKNCEGSCQVKCGEDCLDSVSGKCPKEPITQRDENTTQLVVTGPSTTPTLPILETEIVYSFIWLLVGFQLIPLCLLISLWRRHKRANDAMLVSGGSPPSPKSLPKTEAQKHELFSDVEKLANDDSEDTSSSSPHSMVGTTLQL